VNKKSGDSKIYILKNQFYALIKYEKKTIFEKKNL